MKEVYSTLGSAQLQTDIGSVDGYIKVKNAVNIPTLKSKEYFYAAIYTIKNGRKENFELIKVTQTTTDSWKIIRGEENTGKRSHSRNSNIEVAISKETLEKFSTLIDSKNGLNVPAGSNETRDESGVNFRFNSEIGRFEGWDGKRWVSFGPAYGGKHNYAFYETDARITADYSITEGRNALTTGPVEIEAGVTITIPVGSRWSVI